MARILQDLEPALAGGAAAERVGDVGQPVLVERAGDQQPDGDRDRPRRPRSAPARPGLRRHRRRARRSAPRRTEATARTRSWGTAARVRTGIRVSGTGPRRASPFTRCAARARTTRVNVATSTTASQAARTIGTATIAPLPSPSRMPRSSSAGLPIASSTRRWPGSARAMADDAVVERAGCGDMERQHRRRDDVPVEHDRDRAQPGGDRRRRDRRQLGAARFAHDLDRVARCSTCAPSPRPPRRACARARRRRRRCRARPTSPGRRRASAPARAAAAVVLPMPISPSTSRSVSSASTAATALSTTSSNRSGVIAGSYADVAGRAPTPTSIVVERRPDRSRQRADRRLALAAGREHRRRDRGRVGADAAAAGDAVVAGEHEPGGRVDPRRRGALPRRHVHGDVVEARQRARSGGGCRRRVPAPRRRRRRPARAGARSASSQPAHRSSSCGSCRGKRPPGDHQQRAVGGRDPALVDPPEHVAVAACELVDRARSRARPRC